MSRSILYGLAFGVAALGLACNKGGAEGLATGGQADAAPSDFEKAREDYRHQKQSDLALLDKSVADLQAKEGAAAGKAKTDLQGILSSLKAQRDALVGDLRALDSASASTWDSTKARLDKEWADLKAASDKAVSTAASLAAAVHKPSEMTCEDYVALSEVDRPKIVYWAEGFNKSGKPVDSVIDVEQTDKLIPVFLTECTKTPKESLSKVIQQHAAAAPKPAVAAPAPAKMNCEQFVALQDVVKPKVVYWAEGFGITKDGGAAEAVVDVAETDRLVPVLVTECKETPKLTLWQKLKKYF